MFKYSAACAIAVAGLLTGGAANAQSSFTATCSNYSFFYSGNNAAIRATCLTTKGTPNDTTLTLMGVTLNNGVLTQGSASQASTFQGNCGSIRLFGDGPYVTLSAICRNNQGQFNPTSHQLKNINNSNGNLVQGQ